MNPWDVIGWMIVFFIGFILLCFIVGAFSATRAKLREAKLVRRLRREVEESWPR